MKSGTRGVKIFWRISVIMLVWFDLERPDLVRQHMYGMSVSQPRPVPRDRPYRAPASPFGTSYMRTHSMRNNNHCIVIELDARKIFTGLTTRDLFRERTFLFVIIHLKRNLFSDIITYFFRYDPRCLLQSNFNEMNIMYLHPPLFKMWRPLLT